VGVFERIGWVKLSMHPEPKPAIAAFIRAFLANLDDEIKLRLPCASFEGGKHTMRIV
jgi:hypothetical protein